MGCRGARPPSCFPAHISCGADQPLRRPGVFGKLLTFSWLCFWGLICFIPAGMIGNTKYSSQISAWLQEPLRVPGSKGISGTQPPVASQPRRAAQVTAALPLLNWQEGEGRGRSRMA